MKSNADLNETDVASETAALPEIEEDEHLSESLFHSCIDASEFFDADDANDLKQDERKNETNIIHASNNAQVEPCTDAIRMNTNNSSSQNSQPSSSAATPQNGTSNSSSTTNSSWSHLPTPQTKVNSITFNRERTCLIIATSHGVRIRTLESLHYGLFQTQRASNSSNNATNDLASCSEEWVYDVPFQSGVTYAQLLHTSSTLAVILPHSPRCCFLYNAKNAINPLAALPMSAAVKRVEITKKVLVCITADGRLHIFQNNVETGERPVWIQTLNVMHPSDAVRNISRGSNIYYSGSYFDLLSPKKDECYLVCKSFNGTAGTLRVYDPTEITEVEVSSMNVSINSGGISAAAASAQSGEIRKKVRKRCHLHTTIDAHEHPVTRMLIGSSASSSFVATASSKGTNIRVFGLPHGHQLYEFHRGSRSCQILSLSWNGMGDRLISYGSSNTIHIFEWNNQQKKKECTILEHSHADARDFEEIRESSNQGNAAKDDISEKPLFKRIGASIRQHTVGNPGSTAPLKHRSFAKLKYQSVLPREQQQLVVALLDRFDANVVSGSKSREDTVVMCSSNGELRQYSVTANGSTKLVQLEDVLIK
jgi:hypothetical protein